jgi:uncharacterized membrane protein
VPVPRDRTAARIALALLLAAVIWAGAIVAAPPFASVARAASPELLTSLAIYGVGAVVCHQRPERSFHTAGLQWPVCARCAGLYLSAGIGAGLVLLARSWKRDIFRNVAVRPIPLLFVAAAPTAVSWLAERLGLVITGNAVRAGLAVPLGLACVALVADAWRTAERVGQGEVD